MENELGDDGEVVDGRHGCCVGEIEPLKLDSC